MLRRQSNPGILRNVLMSGLMLGLMVGLALTCSIGAVRAQSPAATPAAAAPAAASSGASALVTVAVEVWPTSLDPAAETTGPPTLIQALNDPVVRFKGDTMDVDQALSLATKVAINGDGLLWEIALKPNQQFSDGTPIDADAVVFSLSRLLKSDHPARPARPALPEAARGVVKNILARNKTTVVLELNTPYSPLVQLLASPRAAIISPASFKDGKLAAIPVGCGPFVVTKQGPGRRLELTPNAKLNRQKPGLPRVHVVPAPTGPARVLWLLAGRGDLIEGLSRRDMEDLSPNKRYKIETVPGIGMVTLYLNPNAVPFQSAPVREAIIRGIPEELLGRYLYDGKATTFRGFYPTWSWGSRNLFKGYAYDQVESKRLVQMASIDRSGTAFVMWIVPPDSLRRDTLPPFLEALRAALRELNISCLTEVVARGDFAQRLAQQAPQAVLYWHDVSLPDPDEVAARCVGKDQLLARFTGTAASEEIQSIVVRARTAEPAAREFLYQQLEEKLVASLTTISVASPQRSVARSDRLTGFQFGMDGSVSLEELRFGP